MIGFCPLASGSKGNCIYVGSAKTRILIDAGLSGKMLLQRLNEIGVDIGTIDAIMITHEHVDHIRGLGVLSSRYQIPILANSDTAKALLALIDEPLKLKIFSTGESFVFGDIEIHPFSVQHDAVDPVAFTLRLCGLKLGFCADLGFATSLVVNQLQGCDYLYLEANHQPEMVHASPRPQVYKQRVLSRQGHLSNDQCADLLQTVYHPGLRHVHLAHLSGECNAPDLAFQIVTNRLLSLGAGTEVSIAFQDKISRSFLFTEG